VVLIGAPIAALALLQTNYVLAYFACAARTNWWLHGPSLVAVIAGFVFVAFGWINCMRMAGRSISCPSPGSSWHSFHSS